MIGLIAGEEGQTISLFKGADDSLIGTILNDDGSFIDLTGDTVHFLIYDTLDRRNAAVADFTAALTSPTAGEVTMTITNAAMNFGPSDNLYYGFLKHILAAGGVTFSRIPVKIAVR